MGLLPMSKSDQYRRFAAECLKMAQNSETEQQRSIFLQMASAWLALAQKDQTNTDRDGDPESDGA